MNNFDITEMRDSSVLRILGMKDMVISDPTYQRPGGVWSLQKRQLFIDSLFNDYDVPKIYLHLLPERDSGGKKYAIIDGRQRLGAIWDFAEDKFALSNDFEFFANESIKVAGKKYSEIAQDNPTFLSQLHGRTLSIVVISTSDIDVVEDMFSRLNEAEPLKAAEKRNAFGGALPRIIRDLTTVNFFSDKIKISPSRYRHHDIATKMLHLEGSDKIVDTKKVTLDLFVRSFKEKENEASQAIDLGNNVKNVLELMSLVFENKDPLLRSSSIVIVYYILFSNLAKNKKKMPERDDLVIFEELRSENRRKYGKDDDDVDMRLIEYDELIQSSNDSSSIKTRYEIMDEYIKRIINKEITRDSLQLDF